MNTPFLSRASCLSSGAQETIDDKVTLKPCSTYDLKRIRSPADCASVASNTEALAAIEDCAAVWMKQIEQVSKLYHLKNLFFQFEEKGRTQQGYHSLN